MSSLSRLAFRDYSHRVFAPIRQRSLTFIAQAVNRPSTGLLSAYANVPVTSLFIKETYHKSSSAESSEENRFRQLCSKFKGLSSTEQDMYQKKAAQLKEERSQIVENYKTLVSKNDKLRLVENIFLYSRVLTRAQKKDPSIKSLYIPKDMPGHEELQEVVNFRYNIMPKLPVENANRAFLRSKENECKKANQPFVLSEAVQKYKLITPEEKEKFAKLSEKDIERYICEVRQLVGIN